MYFAVVGLCKSELQSAGKCKLVISIFSNCELIIGQNLRSLIACGRSGNLMSFICCGMFIFFTAETARAGAAAMPACKIESIVSWIIET